MQSTEMTEMMDKWKIESMMNDSQTNRNLQEHLKCDFGINAGCNTP